MLGNVRVDATSGFFELGGDSLSLVILARRLRARFHVPAKDICPGRLADTARSFSAMASYVRSQIFRVKGVDATSHRIPERARGSDDEKVTVKSRRELTSMQRGMIFECLAS